MIEELKPYDRYQVTDLAWARRLPSHWTSKRGKAVLAEAMLPTSDNQEIVTCFRDGQVTLRRNRRTSGFMIALYEQGYQGVRKGQLVVHAMDAFAGAIGISDSDGKCTPEYIVCDARGPSVSLPYVAQALRVAARDGFILASCPSVRERAPRFRWANLGDFLLPLPPPEEQAAIVRFLDHANRRIDQFIRAKRKLISLLNEQRQAIIHRAVTLGIDPNAKLKDSGVPWLGQVPAHWYGTRLKFEASHIIDCLHATPPYRSDGVFPAIRTADVEPGRLRLEQARRLAEGDFLRWTQRLEPTAGDILYSREGERFGLAAPVPAGVRLCISQRMMVFRIRPAQHSSYIMWQLNCPHVYQQASEHIIGSTSPHVNVEQIRNYLLVLPPRAEQLRIVDHIDAELGAIAPVLLRAEKEIALAREYRTRLVADVVTGQLDVRVAAVSLPDFEPELAPAETSDDEGTDLEDAEAA